MAAARTATAAKSAAAPAAAPAPAAAAPAAAPVEGQGAAPSPAPDTSKRRAAPVVQDPTPQELVKLEKLDFAERMKRAKKAVKDKQAAAKKGGAAGSVAAPAASEEPARAEPEAEAPKASGGKTPRELLEAGDIDGAFEAAFGEGKKPHDFKIDSRRWEEWRKAQLRGKREIQAKREAGEQELATKREAFVRELEHARRTFGPMVEAKKLYDAGDVAGAIQAAFGDDLNAFNKKALTQYHGKNPEVEALRRELEQERRDRADRERKAREEHETTARADQIRSYKDGLKKELIDGSDPGIARLALQGAFVERVFQIKREHYDEASDTTISTVDAAAQARREIVDKFGAAFGEHAHQSESAESVQAGSKPASAKNGHAPTSRTLSQRGAVEASEPGRALTQQERLRKYTELAKAERAANA